jgi:integrase
MTSVWEIRVGKTDAGLRIDTPAMRRKISRRKAPVWSAIGEKRGGLKLGYRKGCKGGVWIAKAVGGRCRRETTLGPADDDNSKPGALTYKSAIAAALDWANCEQARRSSNSETAMPTVASAVTDYIETRQRRDVRRGKDTRSRLTKHVLSDQRLAQLHLENLTVKELRAWANRAGANIAPSTLNRLQNDFRAALNAAIEMHGRELPAVLRRDVAIGLRSRPDAERARKIILTDAEVRELIAASQNIDTDLGAIVLVLASTGCRFSQAAALVVRDLQIDLRRIMIPSSRKGRGTKIRPPIPVPIGDDVIACLGPLIAGRSGGEPLLERWRSRQTGPFVWERVNRGPWRAASEMARSWSKALTSTGVSGGIPPYALRHSSIVRSLCARLPVRIVAALHDTSSAMIEKHYAAFILDIADDLARRMVTPLVSNPITQLSVVAS